MMGIYIPGMEMPVSCFECYWRCKVDPDNLLCRISGEYFEETFSTIKGRYNSCPLVPVPKHGRLIDADAMVKSVMSQYDMIKAFNNSELSEIADVLVRGVLQEIENAPTIIPAEEGEA